MLRGMRITVTYSAAAGAFRSERNSSIYEFCMDCAQIASLRVAPLRRVAVAAGAFLRKQQRHGRDVYGRGVCFRADHDLADIRSGWARLCAGCPNFHLDNERDRADF